MATTRRDVLRLGALAGIWLGGARRVLPASPEPAAPVLNDVHSRLNPTRVRAVVRPSSVAELGEAVRRAGSTGTPLSLSGSRHAMGGQQFGTDTLHLDLRGLGRVLDFDRERGLIEVEAGIEWPDLIDELLAAQADGGDAWGIVQKQTGADRLTLGGAVAANAHGRGLTYRPIVQDVEALTIVGPDGILRRADRGENPELFALAVGGYGLFGPIATVTLRLAARRKLERVVQMVEVGDLPELLAARIEAGYLYGDCQFEIDPASDGFMTRGVFSSYRPVEPSTPIPERQKVLSEADWATLLRRAHTDKAEAFEWYSRYYLSTSGQIYWSDTHQLSTYLDDYHRALDAESRTAAPGSEMIAELYVPRDELPTFMARAAADLRRAGREIIYGTIRWIERDDECLLTWARKPWACIVLNLHVDHTGHGIAGAVDAMRRLIDRALELEGSYFLTYHRWATREQVLAAHPRMPEFLAAKARLDPDELFTSDWYRHHRRLLAGG